MKRILLCLAVLCVSIGCTTWTTGCKPDIATEEHTYPRLAKQFYHIQNWEIGYPFEDLYKYDMIQGAGHGYAEIQAVLKWARASGHGDWADRVIFAYTFCPRSVVAILDRAPHGWEYQLARSEPKYAIAIAVYENQKRGCDWLLKNQHGNHLPIYGGKSYLAHWGGGCPLGKWDGHFSLWGKDYYIGDTRGLKYAEWISGPMKEEVILGSDFAKAFDMIHVDDDPYVGTGAWLVPSGTRYDHDNTGRIFLTKNQYNAQAKPWVRYYFKNFVYDLTRNHKMPTTVLASMYEGFDRDLAQWMHESANGCRMQRYGRDWHHQGSGGLDPAWWWPQWEYVEKEYMPYGMDTDPRLDRLQGADVSYAEIVCKPEWDDIRQHCRHMLGHALMHDGMFAVAWDGDNCGDLKYIAGTGPAPPHIPEMDFELGRAVSDVQQIGAERPTYYRWFENGSTRYTVAVNMWDEKTRGIPARDAVWLKGHWPKRSFRRIKFEEE